MKPLSKQTILQIERSAEQLFSKQEVESALDQMAELISQQLADQNPIILSAVIGGIVPTGMLLPRLNFPLQLDYIHATRYRGKTCGGQLEWLQKPQLDLTDRCVLIIDDILDEGRTLAAIKEFCQSQGARQVFTAVLIEKQIQDRAGLAKADFTGLLAEDKFLVGYGMDYQGYFRNLASISAIHLDD